jgi:hypothetical protein
LSSDLHEEAGEAAKQACENAWQAVGSFMLLTCSGATVQVSTRPPSRLSTLNRSHPISGGAENRACAVEVDASASQTR